MSNFFKIPFADQGDKVEFPFNPDPNSSLDFLRGYNNTYSLPPDAGGTWINRQNFNYLLNMMTSAIRDIQLMPVRDFDKEVQQSGGYGVGEGCLLNYDPYTRTLVKELPTYNNTESTYMQKIKVISLRPNNVTNPYDEDALFDSWYVDDGNHLNTAIIDLTNSSNNIPGYIKANASLIDSYSFPFAVYKRVRNYLKDIEVGDSLGLFIKDSEISFKLKDIRGYFMRIWNNGSTVDSDRAFNDLQEAGLPNVTGSFKMAGNNGGFDKIEGICAPYNTSTGRCASNATDVGRQVSINLSRGNPIYKDSYNDVAPYNFNVNLMIKV